LFFHLGEVIELSTSARSRISATGADIIPKWEYIRTLSADVNELSAQCGSRMKDAKVMYNGEVGRHIS